MKDAIETIKKYLPHIENIFQDNLVSIILFGSLIRGDFIKGQSDVNLLIIRKKRESEEILKLNRIFLKLKRKLNLAVPLVLTETEIKRSTDVFPMEYRDMKDFHLVLKGKNLLKNLKIDAKYLRLELESQIKGKLILLREALMQYSKSKRILKNMLISSIPAITVIMRHIFILNKEPVPATIDSLIDATASITKISFDSFKKLFELKKGIIKLKREELILLYSNYILEISKLSDYIDKFKIKKRKEQ